MKEENTMLHYSSHTKDTDMQHLHLWVGINADRRCRCFRRCTCVAAGMVFSLYLHHITALVRIIHTDAVFLFEGMW